MSKADESFDGFAVLEEAALTMLGYPCQQAFLDYYRLKLHQCFVDRGLEQGFASELAAEMVDIIAKRGREIELAAGSAINGAIQ